METETETVTVTVTEMATETETEMATATATAREPTGTAADVRVTCRQPPRGGVSLPPACCCSAASAFVATAVVDADDLRTLADEAGP